MGNTGKYKSSYHKMLEVDQISYWNILRQVLVVLARPLKTIVSFKDNITFKYFPHISRYLPDGLLFPERYFPGFPVWYFPLWYFSDNPESKLLHANVVDRKLAFIFSWLLEESQMELITLLAWNLLKWLWFQTYVLDIHFLSMLNFTHCSQIAKV